jgi:uncharacterized membrane protein YidH (DUF202 family)
MTFLSLACRVAVIGVFLLAVVGKVHHRAAFARFTESLRDMRLANTRRHLVAAGVVLAEVVVVALLVLPFRYAGFAAAAAMSSALAAGILVARRRGSEAPCQCFGPRDSDAPASLTRPVALIALAGTGLAAEWSTGVVVPRGGELVAAIAAGVLVAALVRFLRPLTAVRRDSQLALDGFDPDREVLAMRGRRLPDVLVTDQRIAAVFSHGGPALLVLLSTSCPGCHEAATTLPRAAGVDPAATVVIISGDRQPAQDMARTVGADATVIIEQRSGSLTQAVDPPGMPLFVLVDEGAVVVAASFSLTELTGAAPGAGGR